LRHCVTARYAVHGTRQPRKQQAARLFTTQFAVVPSASMQWAALNDPTTPGGDGDGLSGTQERLTAEAEESRLSSGYEAWGKVVHNTDSNE